MADKHDDRFYAVAELPKVAREKLDKRAADVKAHDDKQK